MNGLGNIACAAGLKDGLNPCIFMTCAVFMVNRFWLPANSLRITWFSFVFVLVYALGFLEFNFGPAQIFVFQKEFIVAAKTIYLILGTWFFILGILFFKDWFLLNRGQLSTDPANEKMRPFAGNDLIVGLTTVILGLVLSAVSTLWPINNYMMLLGNETFLKGQWQAVMPLLTVYIFMSMWPLWLVWAFLSIKNLKPSLLRIFCAAIFFTASSCVIFMFK
jgi:hypothetical protein